MMIVFVHCGGVPIPDYMGDAIGLAHRIAPKTEIVMLAPENQLDRLSGAKGRFSAVPIESIPASPATEQFRKQSALDRDFRGGFWFHTSERFFVLADFIRHTGAEDVLHLENDVVLYFDPAEKLDAFRSFSNFAVPLDRNRAIASTVWFANAQPAELLAQYLASDGPGNDMERLGAFCMQYPEVAKPLPTLPPSYAVHKQLDLTRYCQGIDTFGGVFDAAAIGQYLGGVHWQNNPHDSRFFVNESSELDLRDFDIAWNVQQGARAPSLQRYEERVGVLSVHAHSKDLLGISPFNHGVPSEAADVITGERLQELADLTVSAAAVTQFHGADNIRSKRRIDLPQNEQGQLLVPDAAFIEECAAADVLFVYTHLLLYFKRYVAPRLTKPFTLISHNSDHAVGLPELDLLNHPSLVRWWAQNCEVCHTRLSALPIGLANRQWGAEKIDQLVAASRCMDKDRLLYVNFAPTHPSRAQALQAAGQVANATIESGVDYPRYLAALSRHKFCACPRGNGLDSHRIWEAWYMNCIPIIVRGDWTSAYSELPLLVLDSWDVLPQVDLQKEYVRLSTTAFRYEQLSLRHFEEAILAGQSKARLS
jgi:hypothetical protein